MSENLPVAEKRANTDWHIRTRQNYFKRKLKEGMDAGELLVYSPESLVDRMAYVTAFDEMLDEISIYFDRSSKGMGRSTAKQDKKVLEMTKNGKMVSYYDLKKAGVSDVTIARMVVDGLLAHIGLGDEEQIKVLESVENEGTEDAKRISRKREATRMYGRGVCSEFSDVISSTEYRQHYSFFEALSKAPVTVIEEDGFYKYRMFGDDPTGHSDSLRFNRNKIFKDSLRQYLDMGLLEFRNGRLFMTDVGKHVHGYSQYCSLTKRDMFDDREPERFVEWITKLDGIPESYKGVPKDGLIELIKENRGVYKIVKNELMDGLAALEEKPLHAIEEDVILRLRLNKLYDKKVYAEVRKDWLPKVKEGIEGSKNELLAERHVYLNKKRELEDKVELFQTKRPDVVFEDKNGKKVAIEVETGATLTNRGKMEEKAALLKKDYGERYFILVSDHRLKKRYLQYGEVVTRAELAGKIRGYF